jgi:hypothetical protein
MATEQPRGFDSTNGSQGELADRMTTPGFPSGYVDNVEQRATLGAGATEQREVAPYGQGIGPR